MLDFLFKRRPKEKGLVGIYVTANRLSCAHSVNVNGKPVVRTVFTAKYKKIEELESLLVRFVSSQHLEGADCNWVINVDDYHLFLIDKPAVPEHEYASAAKWAVKDMVDFPLEELATDVFPPAIKNGLDPEKLYVIASRKAQLEKYARLCERVSLNLVSVDVIELALLNLIQYKDLEREPLALLDGLNNTCILLMLNEDREIYFTRHISLGLNLVKENAKYLLALTEEIQRSFDYCLNQLNQKTPVNFIFSPAFSDEKKIIQHCENCAKVLDIKKINIMDLNQWISFKEPINEELQQFSYLAIAAALRQRKG